MPRQFDRRKTMPLINRIDVRIKTGDRAAAGTDGDIYVGICGREFFVDSAVDDFERNSDRTYIFGAGGGSGSTVNNPSLNDPSSSYQLQTEALGKFPAYVR